MPRRFATGQSSLLSTVVHKSNRVFHKLVYFFLTFAMDVLGTLMWTSKCPKRVEDKPSQSDHWTDEEIYHRWSTMTRLKPSSGLFQNCHVTRICEDTVVKKAYLFSVPNPETLAMEVVRANTNIPTPRVRRTFAYRGWVYIVMEFIEGEELASRWSSLSLWSQFRTAWTLRRYIRQLRRAHSIFSAIPGPLGDTPQPCVGKVLQPRPRGPFADYHAMSAYFNETLAIAKKIPYPGTSEPSASEDVQPFDDSYPLVLTHNDLSMRNIMVDADGKIWMIDWGWSGYFPPWFEYLAAVAAANNDKAPASWCRMIPLITDAWFDQENWMKQIAYALYLFK